MKSPLTLVVVFSFILLSSFHRDGSATPPVSLITAFTPSISRAGGKTTATAPGFSGNIVRGSDAILATAANGKNRASVDNFILSRPPAIPPVITGFTPSLGRPGDIVTITGTGFSPVAGNNCILFASGVAGRIMAATATRLKVRVPGGAATGAISVTTGPLTATSITYFNVLKAISPGT